MLILVVYSRNIYARSVEHRILGSLEARTSTMGTSIALPDYLLELTLRRVCDLRARDELQLGNKISLQVFDELYHLFSFNSTRNSRRFTFAALVAHCRNKHTNKEP